MDKIEFSVYSFLIFVSIVLVGVCGVNAVIDGSYFEAIVSGVYVVSGIVFLIVCCSKMIDYWW